MTTMGSVSLALSRDLAMGVLGSAAFGVAAAAGYGARPMLAGAWIGPALFAGGAMLATPPLYIVTALSGGRTSPAAIAASTTRALAGAATVLLGLAAPVAFFSVTLKTQLALPLLIAATVVVGAIAVIVAGRSSVAQQPSGSIAATVIWCAFAMTLGARLIGSLAPMAFGGWS